MENELKYSFRLQFSDEDGGYIAVSPEFPGLSAYGETPNEALKEAVDALELFIETYSEQGKPLPEANFTRDYSGQIRARLPKSLHERLAMRAEDEGVSLNTLMIQLLCEGLSFQNVRNSYENALNELQQTYRIRK